MPRPLFETAITQQKWTFQWQKHTFGALKQFSTKNAIKATKTNKVPGITAHFVNICDHSKLILCAKLAKWTLQC